MGLFDPCNPAVNAIIIYIILILIVVIIKPNFLYDHKSNKFKEFGCNQDQTYMPLMLFGVLASITLFFIFMFIAGLNCIDRKKIKYLMKYA
jgi:hypothetical protein